MRLKYIPSNIHQQELLVFGLLFLYFDTPKQQNVDVEDDLQQLTLKALNF